MQAIDNEFFEAYKRLDRLCSDIYGCRNGVSQYIEDMERVSYQGRLAIPSWEQAYRTLKHLRWVRNQLAHNCNSVKNVTFRTQTTFMTTLYRGATRSRSFADTKKTISPSKNRRNERNPQPCQLFPITLMLFDNLAAQAAFLWQYCSSPVLLPQSFTFWHIYCNYC